ncbi:hypothetical protein PENSPDRAFT_476315 [Peniophora sp. CONT]|nr:hypothetical protein PENSPDRAFT_476315 [Peniophora sp. CONT]
MLVSAAQSLLPLPSTHTLLGEKALHVGHELLVLGLEFLDLDDVRPGMLLEVIDSHVRLQQVRRVLVEDADKRADNVCTYLVVAGELRLREKCGQVRVRRETLSVCAGVFDGRCEYAVDELLNLTLIRARGDVVCRCLLEVEVGPSTEGCRRRLRGRCGCAYRRGCRGCSGRSLYRMDGRGRRTTRSHRGRSRRLQLPSPGGCAGQ